jgi:protease-4
MKKFFKFLLQNTFVGIISGLTVLFFGLVLVFAMLASFSSGTQTVIPKDSILILDLSMNLKDTPPRMGFEEIVQEVIEDNVIPTYHLQDLVETIERAKNDSRISGILLQGSFIPRDYGSSYPSIHELKVALEDFKTSGKELIAYSVSPSLRDLYVMTVADEFILNPSGLIALPGLYSERMFFGDAMDKYGIGVQTVRVGDYKAGIEPFTRSSMSKESREASQLLLDELWIQILGNLAASRDVDPFSITKQIQTKPIFFAESALEASLISGIKTSDEMVKMLIEITGEAAEANTYKGVALDEYITERDMFKGFPSGPGVAIVYAEGNIVGGIGEHYQAGAQRIVNDLREAHNNPDIKAIVLRVNSPGGGATASKTNSRRISGCPCKRYPIDRFHGRVCCIRWLPHI